MLRQPARRLPSSLRPPALVALMGLMALLISACSKPTHRRLKHEPEDNYREAMRDQAPSPMSAALSEDEAPRAYEAAPKSRLSKKSASSRAGIGSAAGYAPEPPAPAPAAAPTGPAVEPPKAPVRAKRMVHYSGRATVRSTEPEKVLDSAVAMVKAEGGFLEQRSMGFVAVRVPAEKFDSLFYRLMRLGEVVDFSQQAEDITEAFQDTELRLKVVSATLERLEDLIKKAKTESQKLRLLREMKRLREEKEVLEGQRKELVQKARFASIHFWVQGHTPQLASEIWRQDIADFLWIHGLNPYDDNRFDGRSTVKFGVPSGMVVSKKKKPWRATSSHGSEFWGSRMKVDPIGDSRFWAEAIRVRLKDGFKIAETRDVGEYRFCRFQSYGPTPYFYWVGVRARKNKLRLAEFYFPTEAEQAALLPALLASVEKAGK